MFSSDKDDLDTPKVTDKIRPQSSINGRRRNVHILKIEEINNLGDEAQEILRMEYEYKKKLKGKLWSILNHALLKKELKIDKKHVSNKIKFIL